MRVLHWNCIYNDVSFVEYLDKCAYLAAPEPEPAPENETVGTRSLTDVPLSSANSVVTPNISNNSAEINQSTIDVKIVMEPIAEFSTESELPWKMVAIILAILLGISIIVFVSLLPGLEWSRERYVKSMYNY